MTQQAIRREQETIYRSIKATVAQLDHWDNDQRVQERRRVIANANYPNGVLDRQTLAQHRARVSQGTLDLIDPQCTLCGSLEHLTDECHLEIRNGQVVQRAEESNKEASATAIHRAIVHRLYSQSCELYALLYPLFFQRVTVALEEQVDSDYQALAISGAVEDFRLVSSFRPSDIRDIAPGCSSITQLYYSKAFSLTYGEFCCQIADRVERSHSTL
jgi:hypothetical protein